MSVWLQDNLALVIAAAAFIVVVLAVIAWKSWPTSRHDKSSRIPIPPASGTSAVDVAEQGRVPAQREAGKIESVSSQSGELVFLALTPWHRVMGPYNFPQGARHALDKEAKPDSGLRIPKAWWPPQPQILGPIYSLRGFRVFEFKGHHGSIFGVMSPDGNWTVPMFNTKEYAVNRAVGLAGPDPREHVPAQPVPGEVWTRVHWVSPNGFHNLLVRSLPGRLIEEIGSDTAELEDGRHEAELTGAESEAAMQARSVAAHQAPGASLANGVVAMQADLPNDNIVFFAVDSEGKKVTPITFDPAELTVLTHRLLRGMR